MLYYTHITQLLTELLYKHDCVIVPNFGGFITRSYSAGFSKGNDLLYPPSKHIIFNKNLTHNDGLLVSAVALKNNYSINEATKQVTDYTDYLQSVLLAKKRFEFDNIGLIYIDGENNLRFEPKVDVNFLIHSFGLEPVIAKELEIQPEKAIVSKPFEDRKIVTESTSIKKRSYAKMATLAIGIPLTVGFLFFAALTSQYSPLSESSLNPFYKPEKTYQPIIYKTGLSEAVKQSSSNSLIVDANGYTSFKLSENGPSIVANINDTATLKDATIVENKTKVKRSSNSFDGTYQVVMGCFGVENNAKKLVKELELKNIGAGISGINSKGLHVVSCGGFNTKEEAADMLANVKSQFPNAWIMTK